MSKKQEKSDDTKVWVIVVAILGFFGIYILGSLFAWSVDLEETNNLKIAIRNAIILTPFYYVISGIIFGLNGRFYKIGFITPKFKLIFYLLLPLLFVALIYLHQHM